jgi:hypothetical protein
VAEWLRSGLQSRLHRFDSGRRLGKALQIDTFWLGNCADDRLLSHGSQITGSFTLTSARKLGDELQSGSLPIKLELISSSRMSAAASP